MRLGAPLLCLAVGTSVLQAKDSNFGLQFTGAKPQGDLGTLFAGKMGYGFGLHALTDLGGGEAVMPRFEWTTYNRSQNGNEVGLQEFRIGLDFDYFVSGRTGKGFFVGAGLGYGWGTLDARVPATFHGDETSGAIYFTGGLGWMFTENVGVEVKYYSVKYGFNMLKTANISAVWAEEVYQAPSINYTLIVRF